MTVTPATFSSSSKVLASFERERRSAVGGEFFGVRIFFGLFSQDDRLLTPSASNFRVRRGTDSAPERDLAARHRDVPVVEDLIRDIDTRGDAGFDGEEARVEQRAIADVLENVTADRRKAPCRSRARLRRPFA